MQCKGVVGRALILAGALSAAGSAIAGEPVANVSFAPVACPATLAKRADCHEGQDANGAWLLAAIPRQWNRKLVVHAHGGPRLGVPKAGDSAEDLARFAGMVEQGYAWIGSTYRRGGFGVRMAAADVDASRAAFWARWGRPERTWLHGQSWGANVAAKAAELHALDIDGRPNFDGVLTTNGQLAGGTRGYQFRVDLRAVYQYYCRNHPAPDEEQYPLWQGLPAEARLSREQLATKVSQCTGVDLPAGRRSPAQAKALREILAVTHVPEQQLVAHLAWATFQFRDIVHKRLGGRNPFDNSRSQYRGSSDDAALNAGVERFSADPAALAALAYDADLSGLIVLPTVTVHARYDPVIPYQADAAYATVVRAAGREGLLLQALTEERDHSKVDASTYLAALAVLEQWLQEGQRPAPAAFARACKQLPRQAGDCRFQHP